jgi:formylglycine-generating enzyme required for sulfatase activity
VAADFLSKHPAGLRAANRVRLDVDYRVSDLGFRVARTLFTP